MGVRACQGKPVNEGNETMEEHRGQRNHSSHRLAVEPVSEDDGGRHQPDDRSIIVTIEPQRFLYPFF